MYVIKLLFKNAFRHKLRTSLTVLGISVALLAFGLLRTLIGAWYAGIDASSASRLVSRNAISLIFPLPISYKEKIRQIDGVKLVSYGNWFGGIYIDEKNFFANFAVDPKSYLELYPEFIIQPDQKKEFIMDRKGFAAGKKLVEKYGWKLGDTVTLKGTIFPGDWDFVLRAIYKGRDRTVDETQFFFHWDYLNETMKEKSPARAEQAGFYMIGVNNPGLAADVAAAIDKTFKNSLAETLTESEKAFVMSFISMTEAILIAIKLISIVIIVIIMAVVANTMAMTVRERISEYAILKTLGFGGFYVAGIIFGESIVISMIGCAAGIALTFPAVKIISETLSTFFPVFFVSRETIILDITASMAVGIVAAIFPTWRAINLKIADALRKVG